MSTPLPQYLLISSADTRPECQAGHWRFRIESDDGSPRLDADEEEPRVRGERLELLAVVRGLEALDQPSAVTLMTDSNYVLRGLSDGLDEWRANGWTWEAFGDMVPVKNRDLWQRIDRAMTFHRVEYRRTGRRQPDRAIPAPHFPIPATNRARATRRTGRITGNDGSHRLRDRCTRLIGRLLGRLRWSTAGCGIC